ncbi:MAG: response regulator [Polyangiaceae bacterium]|jgi:two-component system, chemotaxis family, chemotaxis protein CheY|nr:response regulator [Polyangiaceae bacterium]
MVRVLLVEDSASTRSFIRAILEGVREGALAGCTVQEATSGFDAMRLLPRGPYDLVLTDINMPDINGLEVIQFVRKSPHHKDTPLVIISTQTSERDIARALALGATAYLRKPFVPEELVATLERVLAPKGGAAPHG